MPLDVVIAPLDLWSEMHECDMKLKMRVRRMKEGREFRGGFSAFSSCFPGLCEGRLNSIQPMSLSQPCLPVANLGPTRILPHLYLGSQKDVLNKDLMAQNGITYVLNASNTCPQPDFICESHFMRVPVDDSYCEKLLPWLERSNLFIEKAKLSNCRVIVHCLAGISRSATIAIAYIMKTMGLSSDEAYRFVKDRRPSISPNFNFLGQLLEFEKGLKLLKALTSGQGNEENLDLEGRESKSQDARPETEPPEKKPEPLKTDSIIATSPASLQQGLSSLHLSAERILDASQLKRSFSLNIRSAYTSGPCPRAVATSENIPKLCELNCSDSFCLPPPAGGGQGLESPHGGETRARQRRKGKHSDCAPNSPALLPEESLQASLLLNLPVAGSSSVWTQHRTMVQSTSQSAPIGHDTWFFPAAVSPFGPVVQLREKPRGARGDSRGSWHEGGPSATAANKQFNRRSCQMEFEDGISETHSCEELGKLGKQPSFSGSMDIIEVS